MSDAGRSPEDILALRAQHLGPSLSVSYRRPLKMVRGEMQFLFDHTGQAYLDCVNNVCHVGHCHPKVVEAGQRQMAKLNTNTRYLHDSIVDYATELTSRFPDPLNVCYLVCSGSEANELALRLARTASGGHDLIVVDGGYHGNTSALVDISPYKHDGPGGRGSPDWVHTVSMPDTYRGTHRDPSLAGPAYAREVKDAASIATADKPNLAGFIHESVLSCGGQIPLPPGYLDAAYKATRSAGGVCIADEVQVGFGRVGEWLWGFELQNVVPDIVTLGKPMGNGHPLGAVLTTRDIARAFDNGMEYFNTFGGNPVSCAIGLAVLDVIEQEGLQEHARTVGNHFMQGLRDLQIRHPGIGDVRGHGLFLGIEFVKDPASRTPDAKTAGEVVEQMRDRHILLSSDGPYHNVIKIKPPMPFSVNDADRVIAEMDDVLKKGTGSTHDS
ncbi:MAG: aminotransferase class III-fold pyridoxal phosphate-dependent enzyme [Proteobacteria bacterium]|nr:aminotransferase class III-fold pyridoxal phosphate-dependent enzyme [Pseudomonadota bacterium]